MLNDIIMIVVGTYFVYYGIKVKKKSPDKTIKIFKTVNFSKFMITCGIFVVICGVVLFLGKQIFR